ncbi:hypothetical protein SAMN05444149_102356 [Pseudosulfitobacter pseudonitzschiae]|uniref:SnoaL-like domain-containing protein n=1 Tax=Pseudosulfitobacter pseudonitzschiae TaxID=1402135 RepID=A0A073J1Z8_9RHOB|nr:hypothetical protein [Pseudosulfitobacter pseudonitzschiae]KEJ95999.1 hypothetical protein SUH3_17200 [Pseudosulfitobacter pseudonitzschiae]QKS09842.1 hypothetical protein HT745_15785 [Pseudosulfitobacter pseudonitzschiae]SHE93669.1 hypothetical protein SAMN05444149_102356 [Pseudosulfitobacter pseudonitzschiae]
MKKERTEIIKSADCGNSPKNAFVQAIAIALETGEADPESFAPTVTWDTSATDRIEGRTALIEAIEARSVPTKVVIEHAISHGRVGAATGETIMANGHRRRFSHVLTFTNSKATTVATLKSFR